MWLGPPGFNLCLFLLLTIFSDVVWRQGFSIVGQLNVSVSPRFFFLLVLIVIYLLVLDDNPLTTSPGGPNN